MLFISLASTYSCFLRIRCKFLLLADSERGKREAVLYTDLAFSVFQNVGMFGILTCMSICNVGGCTGFIIFIANSLSKLFGGSRPEWVLFISPFVYRLVFIRDMKRLVPTSILGTFCLFLSIMLILYHGLTSHEVFEPSMVSFRPTTFLIFFGMSLFAMGGINAVLSLPFV